MISILYKISIENHIKTVYPNNKNVAEMFSRYELKIKPHIVLKRIICSKRYKHHTTAFYSYNEYNVWHTTY